MFGLGFGEILVILVVVLLVFGPEKLPEVARTLGKTMAELRRGVDDIRHELTVANLDAEVNHPPRAMPSNEPQLAGTCEEKKTPADVSPPIPEAAPASAPLEKTPEPKTGE